MSAPSWKPGRGKLGSLAPVLDGRYVQALAFEAEMPAGLARMASWPDQERGYRWAVESRTRKGRNRCTEDHYTGAT